MIRKPKVPVLALLLSLALAAGCSAPRPVLTPNARTEEVGEAAAEADVGACVTLAQKHLEGSERTGDLVLFTAFMVVGGAAVGAGYGALQGLDSDQVGTGAAAEAIGTAIAGLIYGIVEIHKEARRRERERKALVDDCLRPRGYDPRGWE